MKNQVERTGRWIYRGIWAVLVHWFRVPDEPPSLPLRPGESAHSFQPAPGFLRYLKLQFWIVLLLFDGLIAVGWAAVAIASPAWGAVLALPALALAVLPDIVVYLAIHLRYDTTWYVMTERSLRIRRGIWVIHETTITFENVQNIKVTQGPVQRIFGIADVLVETAGGGSGQSSDQHGQQLGMAHHGLIEGIADAPRVRDLILSRLRRTQTTGLGDETEQAAPSTSPVWRPEQVALLREIRDVARGLASCRGSRIARTPGG
jgi:membrane protein YdbS with pleckstrin-like domain